VADPLSPTDRSSLTAEHGVVNMAVAGLIVTEGGPGITYETLCQRVTERIHLLPGFRKRIEQPALGLASPVWVDDENFDVQWHVRQATLSTPDDAALDAYIGREASRLMDRSRPLWELHLVGGLPDGQIAVIAKMHHALVDGTSALGAGMVLLDPGPQPLPVDAPAEQWTPEPYDLGRHLARIADSPIAKARRLVIEGTARLLETSALSAAADVARATDVVIALAGSRPKAPVLPINRPISANRSWGRTTASLSAIKAAGRAAGGTVNDAILAIVCAMLDGYLREAGVQPDQLPSDPVALVPVNIRRPDDPPGGNRISVVFVDLPVGEPDPRRRIEILSERMTAIKGSAKVAAGAFMVDMTGFAPPLLSSIVARAPLGGAFNIVVTNVPGPQAPLYLNGSRVLGIYPIGSLNPADQGLLVGVLSYDGTVCFGLSADRNLDPPVTRAIAALDAAIADVSALAGRRA
jgi:WS/DGAT/MGAT family acyltransferase